MKPTHPLPVHHSWPLYERDRFFELGQLHGCATLDCTPGDGAATMTATATATLPRLGRWECDLDDGNRLSWSDEVYDLFGIARGALVQREDAAALYAENSRAAMEKLRAYAIRHRRGFTLDVEIRPAQTASRWIRLIAAPICVDDRVVRLHGLKFLVPAAPD